MINLKEFKQAVLQRAMQGKLTKQLSSDGNAKDLLVKIANRKRDLVQTGKLKGYSKALSPVTDKEIPFKIPDSWEWTRLGDLVIINSGLSYKKRDLSNNVNDIRIIRGGNISNNGRLSFNSDDYRINSKFITNNRVFLQKNQLVTPVSTSPKHTGKLALVPHLASKVIAGGFVYQITPFLNGANISLFLLYNLSSYSIEKEILNITHLSGSALCNLPKTKFTNIPVPLPPLSEQQRIVSKVHKCFLLADTIQKERDLHQKFAHDIKQSLLLEAMKGHLTQQLPSDGTADDLLKRIQQKKQQLIQAGKIHHHKKLPPISKNEIPFKIPKNWKWVRLQNILEVRDGTHSTPKYVSHGIPLITGKNIINHTINFSNVKYIKETDAEKINRRSKVNKNDIIMTMIGATTGNLGINKSNNIFSIKNVALIKNNNFININFIFYNLMTNIYSVMKTKTSGSAQKFISLTNLRNMIIPLPPLSEQHRIVSKLHDLFNTINA